MVATSRPTFAASVRSLAYSTIREKLSQYSVGSPPPKNLITNLPVPVRMRFRMAFLVPRSMAAFAISQGMAPNFLGWAPEKQYLHPRLQSFVGKKQIVASSNCPLGKKLGTWVRSNGFR